MFTENPVLQEEFLINHNADIISGPHDLVACFNLSDLGGGLALTSPRLLKTKSRNFLIHIKTIHDVPRCAVTVGLDAPVTCPSCNVFKASASGSPAGTGRKGVSNRRKGILRYLFPSINKLSSTQLAQSLAAASSTIGKQTSVPAKVPMTGLSADGLAEPFPYDVQTNAQPATLPYSQQPCTVPGHQTRQRQWQVANGALATSGQGLATAKLNGWDWLNEVHVTVRAFKSTPLAVRLPNERHQRIAMCESTHFLHELLALISTPDNGQQKHLALDILLWLMIVRMGRFRSPKSSAAKAAAAMHPPATAGGSTSDAAGTAKAGATTGGKDYATEMVHQQQNCVQAVQQHLVELLRNCILFGNRSTARKCVKVLLVLTE